jgi:hypothetical protein
MAHVLSSTTPAPCTDAALLYWSAASTLPMISESDTFIWQPYVSISTDLLLLLLLLLLTS